MNVFRYCQLLLIISFVQSAQAEDLLTIYQQALQADPQLKNAIVKVEIGSNQKDQAIGQMLPQVNASANWSQNEQSVNGRNQSTNSNYPGTRYYVSLNQTLFDFTKYWEWQRTLKIEDQYATEAIEARNQLMFNVVDRYFSTLEAEDQLNFAKMEEQAAQKLLTQIQKQFAKQLLKITDFYAGEARLDQLVANVAQAESKYTTSQESLRELTGVTPNTLNILRESVEYSEIQGNLQQWIEIAQNQNPAVLAKRIAIIAAQNNVDAQKSKFLPVVDLQLSYYDTNTGYQSSNLGSDVKTRVAAINVNLPLFSGWITSYQVSEAQNRLQLTKNDNDAAIRAITKETSDAYLSTNAGVRRIQAIQKALKSSSKSREAMERGYQLGVVTISDVIKSQQDESSVKKDLAKEKYNYIKNRVRFMHAIGSLKEVNLQEINGWLEVRIQK